MSELPRSNLRTDRSLVTVLRARSLVHPPSPATGPFHLPARSTSRGFRELLPERRSSGESSPPENSDTAEYSPAVADRPDTPDAGSRRNPAGRRPPPRSSSRRPAVRAHQREDRAQLLAGGVAVVGTRPGRRSPGPVRRSAPRPFGGTSSGPQCAAASSGAGSSGLFTRARAVVRGLFGHPPRPGSRASAGPAEAASGSSTVPTLRP